MKLQEKIPAEWNFLNHLALIGAVYTFIYTVSNLTCFAVFARKKQKNISANNRFLLTNSKAKAKAKSNKKKFLRNYVENPPKACKILNIVITTMLAIDIASFPLVKKIFQKTYR